MIAKLDIQLAIGLVHQQQIWPHGKGTSDDDSLLRRYRVYKGKREEVLDASLHLDEDRRCAVKNGRVVELTSKEYDILQYFFLHRGKVLDVRSVYEGAWGEKYMPTSTNTVMVHILNLRKKLEEDPTNPKLIRTIWGKGYQFG